VTSRGPLKSFDLYLARHGETEWSLSGQHTGVTDLPLTGRGEERARALGARLQGMRFDRVYSSPLRRARRTAELAGFAHPELTDLLREVDYGRYEGLSTEQIHKENPDWELYRDGSPGGETPHDIYTRACAFVDLATSRQAEGAAIAFAHGHILRAVAVAWIAADITLAARLQLDVATLNLLRVTDRGHVIGFWNAQ
jgi:broad specificity phosphatase PhoE